MPQWVLVCPECKADLQLWNVDDRSLAEFLLPPKPVLPVNGIATLCSSCGKHGIYQSSDLTLRLLK